MKIFYGGIAKLIGGLFGGGGEGGNTYITQGAPAPNDSYNEEKRAAEEASRKSAAEAATRNGARASLLTDPSGDASFGGNSVAKKSLLG